MRLAIACSLVVSLGAVAAPALAAKPPVCKLLLDNKGDGYPQPTGPAVKSPALDITSADVATGKTQVVAVLRLATTDAGSDPLSIAGMEWSVNFVARGTSYSFQRRYAGGVGSQYRYELNGSNVGVTGNQNKTEIRWTAPRSRVPELKKANTVFDTIAATSRWFTFNADAGGTSKKYADRTPSCLKPR